MIDEPNPPMEDGQHAIPPGQPGSAQDPQTGIDGEVDDLLHNDDVQDDGEIERHDDLLDQEALVDEIGKESFPTSDPPATWAGEDPPRQ